MLRQKVRHNVQVPNPSGGGGGYSWEFLVGLCRPIPQILTLFKTKTVIFHTHFMPGL